MKCSVNLGYSLYNPVLDNSNLDRRLNTAVNDTFPL